MQAAIQYDAHVVDWHAWRAGSGRFSNPSPQTATVLRNNGGAVGKFNRIANELKQYGQFVNWRWEWRKDDPKHELKPTKIPYQCNGRLASVTNPQTWNTFEAVCAAQICAHTEPCDPNLSIAVTGFSGIGYVFTKDDPFFGCDCDDTHGDNEALARQQDYEKRCGTYSEFSPSGNGLHFIGKAKLSGNGRRRNFIELYDSGRFFTMTGNVYRDTPIRECQQVVDEIYSELGGPGKAQTEIEDQPEREIDEAVISRARNAKNGAKFSALFAGQWDGIYPSQSEADQALVNLVQFHTKNRAQIARIFRQSVLGRTPKGNYAHRGDRAGYVNKMIENSFDRELPPVEGQTEFVKNLQNKFSAMSGNMNGSNGAEGTGCGTSCDLEWPTLDPVALYGLAGDIVRAIEPHTESDPVAILAQALLAFGAHVGRGPHVAVEGDQHHGNLFLLLVGKTSKGRKGTSWGRVRELFVQLPGWVVNVSGLSSGEGLKWAVRDAVEGKNAKDAGDPGAADKRLLVVESEFAQALRATARTGNTLSSTVREAWDTGNLRTLTKNDPIVATGAHIAIIGHITVMELRSELTETDRGNGFANRFLFLGVRRSKSLPFGGGKIDERTVANLIARLTQATDAARQHGCAVQMTQAARGVWEKAYPVLSEGLDGLLGAVTGRAEAQCVRLALLYALLDRATEIDEPHLRAALALWKYSEQSARYIFGSAIGNRVADEILRALRSSGDTVLTRTEISRLFKGHESTDKITAALNLLKSRNLAHCETRSTDGRSVEVWRAGPAN